MHPAWLFPGPIAAVGTSLRELFALFRAESDEAIRGGGFEWTIHAPPARGRPLSRLGRGDRGRAQAEPSLGAMDVTRFRIEITAAGGVPVASIGSTWLVLRGGA